MFRGHIAVRIDGDVMVLVHRVVVAGTLADHPEVVDVGEGAGPRQVLLVLGHRNALIVVTSGKAGPGERLGLRVVLHVEATMASRQHVEDQVQPAGEGDHPRRRHGVLLTAGGGHRQHCCESHLACARQCSPWGEVSRPGARTRCCAGSRCCGPGPVCQAFCCLSLLHCQFRLRPTPAWPGEVNGC